MLANSSPIANGMSAHRAQRLVGLGRLVANRLLQEVEHPAAELRQKDTASATESR